MSGEVLQRFAGSSTSDQGTKCFKLLWRHGIVGMRDDESPVATGRVPEQRRSLKTRLGYAIRRQRPGSVGQRASY